HVTGRVANVGTGSGCIALSLAAEGAFSEVVGTDLSADALALARENRERSGSRVALVQGNLCGPLRHGAFDALISNPPYLTAGEYATLDPSVLHWEPRQALVGGEDGLEHIFRILDEGREVMRAGGWVALEVDCNRAGECAGRAGALGWTDVAIHADLFGRERYLLARRSDTQ
ncbi:MAG: N5-glutamine methyltransferase family protein, partial [Gemmatimonadales bacterium]